MFSLSKTNLADTAVEAIREEILKRRWAVGEKLPNEATLSAMLSVSRGTVREAVRVLVSQGFLETRQGSGTYVLSTVDATRPLTGPEGRLTELRLPSATWPHRFARERSWTFASTRSPTAETA